MSQAAKDTSKRTQLGRKDWIDAAIAVMVASSVEQVRIEKLASQVGATRGSFYWHFADREELLMAVLSHWRDKATIGVQTRLERAEPLPERRLLAFMLLPFRSEASLRAADLELAILGWARRSEPARIAVEQVDRLRTEHITSILTEMGFNAHEAEFRAHKAYAFLRYAAQRRDLGAQQRSDMTARMHGELVGVRHEDALDPQSF